MFKLFLEGTHVGYLFGGAPPGAPEAPPGPTGCPRDLEKLAKIPKNYIKISHASKYTKL